MFELQFRKVGNVFTGRVSMKTGIVALALALILLCCSALAAQVKSPQDYLGFRVGEDYKLADWQQIYLAIYVILEQARIVCLQSRKRP